MKKFLSAIAILGAVMGSSQAATSTVTGAIDPIVIGPVFQLQVVTVRTRPASAGDPLAVPPIPAVTFAQDFPGGTALGINPVVNGSLYFGTVNLLGSGIYVNSTPTAATGLYSGTAHRAGGLYTETRLYMDNNSANFNVSLTVSGNLVALVPPTNTAAEGTSVMHTTSLPLVTLDAAGAVTQFPANIVSADTMRAIPNGTPLTLYGSGTPVSPISDAFKTLTFLDFLPINIPAGTYTGTNAWTMTSI